MNDKHKLGVDKPWAKSVDNVLAGLETTSAGLSSQQAAARQARYGRNELPEPEAEPWWKNVLEAFIEPLALILLGAALISAVLGVIGGDTDNVKNAVLLFAIVVVMALVAVVTDNQANKALEELKKIQKNFARVMRDGVLQVLESSELVPGDIILLSEGDKVPADARVISEERSEVDEALLTGESLPVKKQTTPNIASASLAERTSMVFNGTNMQSGAITAVVVSTGIETELGAIWLDVSETEEALTPLQVQLAKLGQILMWGTLIVCFAVVGVSLFRGVDLITAFMTAVALAIAFIPEALGMIIMIALALGVREMVARDAIIKRLRAAEGLGSVSLVLTDKTGTLTVGDMRATHAWTLALGDSTVNGENDFVSQPDVQRLLRVAQLCNNLGNQTERAIAKLAALAGFEITADSRENRILEVAFSSARKMMSTIQPSPDNHGAVTLFTKGAPERLLDRCVLVLNGTGPISMTDTIRQQIEGQVASYEERGFRVLAFADRDLVDGVDIDEGSIEQELTFIGLIALSDPARPEVRDTIKALYGAGVTPKMITGDSPRTALAIAKDVGMVPATATMDEVVLGVELNEMFANGVEGLSEANLQRILAAHIFARTSPSNKIDLVRAHQRGGFLVAMSGDGVNDAPAIKQADIGVAMDSGTDVTKEVADVIIGGYSSISAAVEVGRAILQRTRLYTHALLSTNGAEVLIFIVAVAFGWSMPLTAVQLLLINVLGDAWLSIALATEKAEPDTMSQKPRDPKQGVITNWMYGSIAVQSVITTIILAVGFVIAGNYASTTALDAQATLMLQQSTVFSLFIVQKVLRSSFTARSLRFNLWTIGFFSNKWTLLSAAATVAMAVAAMFATGIFGMTPLPSALLPLLALGLIPPAVEELLKFGRRITGH